MLKSILSILGAIAILCGALGPYLLLMGVNFGSKLILIGGIAALLGHSLLDISKANKAIDDGQAPVIFTHECERDPDAAPPSTPANF